MVLIPVRCPYCQSEYVIKGGKTDTGKQRYRCHNPSCSHQSFLLDSAYKGRSPQIKQQVIDLSLNGSGVRDTARVLRISPTTVIAVLKKASTLHAVNPALIPPPRSRDSDIPSGRVAEIDERWSVVGAKATERWLWHAIDHHTGRVLASVAGTRKDAEFLKLRALLAPLGIEHYYTDKAGVYQRHPPPAQHTVGKLSMQKIERKHLTLRTRLKRFARKTLCFSRLCLMHDLAIGLYMNYVEFGCAA